VHAGLQSFSLQVRAGCAIGNQDVTSLQALEKCFSHVGSYPMSIIES
jgi:hypothetical protein